MNNREDVLMQIWRDYYDEILEVNLDKGTFESQISTDPEKNRKGYLYIETRIVAKKSVHPDDREDFLNFFDPKKILDDMKKDIFVNKLNFRMHRGDKEYFWVKVKGIMPSRQLNEDTKYFCCFRVLDTTSEEDYGYMQRISTELMHEKEITSNRKAMMEQYTDEIRIPLEDIIGLANISRSNIENTDSILENLNSIDAECKRIELLLEEMVIQIGGKEAAPIVKEVDMLAGRHGKTSAMQRKHSENEEQSEKSDASEQEGLSDDIAEEPEMPQGIIPKIEDINLKGLNILAYIDNALGARIMTEMIENVGANAYVFTSGEEAVREFISSESGKFGVVLLDSTIEEFNLGSAARCIRFSLKEDAASVPIIAITDKTNVSATRNIDGANINDIFRKPIDFGLLFLKIRDSYYKAEKGT